MLTEDQLSKECNRVEAEVGFPMIIRPSNVLGGRGMEIVYDKPALLAALKKALTINAY